VQETWLKSELDCIIKARNKAFKSVNKYHSQDALIDKENRQ